MDFVFCCSCNYDKKKWKCWKKLPLCVAVSWEMCSRDIWIFHILNSMKIGYFKFSRFEKKRLRKKQFLKILKQFLFPTVLYWQIDSWHILRHCCELCKKYKFATLGELWGLSKMVLTKSVAFVVLEILHSLVSMQNSLNANKCWHKQNCKNCPRSCYIYFWCTFRVCHSFFLKCNFLDCRKCC